MPVRVDGRRRSQAARPRARSPPSTRRSTPTTRTVKLRASVPNNDEKLRPGMFVNVSVVLPEQGSVVAVPATAVVHASYGDSVFVVEDKKDPRRRPVTRPGRQAGQGRAPAVRAPRRRRAATSSPIADGVKAGQEVVSAGAFKLRNGAPVVVEQRRSSSTPAARPRAREPLSAMKLHRHLHPPAGAGDRRQPGHHHRRPAGDPHAQRAPVPAGSRARPSPCAPSTSAPAPIWCAASSPRRSSARSPPPTASTTSSRRASRACRRSTSA